MPAIFHPGEIEVQTRSGVRQMADRIANGIHPSIPPVGQAFLEAQPMLVAASIDGSGQVWASLLVGAPGFARALDSSTLLLSNFLVAGIEPFNQNILSHPEIGFLAIELATRRRMRLNGRAEPGNEGSIKVYLKEVYSNCQKYIQRRELAAVNQNSKPVPFVELDGLNDAQKHWIESADTFFIASYNPGGGADVSHRGGKPGFIQVKENVLLWPDYSGNKMFNTLGNIQVNPGAGLLFLDFEGGDILQLAGEARIIWDEKLVGAVPGAERLVEFRVKSAREYTGLNPLRWEFREFSPHNLL